MTRKYFIAILLLLVLGTKVYSQTNFTTLLSQRLDNYLLNNLQEKIYVQTNSNEYAPGDTIWFKSTLVNAVTHSPADREKMIYVDLISPDNKVVYHQVYFIFGGFSAGCLPIKNDFQFGTYRLITYTNYMRNFSKDFFFQKDIEILKPGIQSIAWDFDSEITSYAGGDSVTVFMQAKKENGEGINSEANVNVNLAMRNTLGGTSKITNGAGSFKFFVPDSLQLPTATLTLNLPFQQAGMERYQIELSPSKPDLQFLPESGSLIPNRINNLAFKCIDNNGLPLDVSGKVYDNDHELITSFRTQYQGMGKMNFFPLDSIKYTAEIKWKGEVFTYDLPTTLSNSYGIYLKEETSDSLYFLVIKPSNRLETITILGHSRGLIKYFVSGNTDVKEKVLSVAKVNFPSGIVVFTLMAKNYPRAERLVYIERNDQVNIDITQNKASFEKRDKVELNLKISNQDGSPVVGSFSLNAFDAITEQTLSPFENIQNYLLNSSDLSGKIFQAPVLFDKSNPNYARNMDLLMLTNGWRRFNWASVYSTDIKEKKYSIEEELNLEGEIRRAINNKPVPKNFKINVSLKKDYTIFFAKKIRTDEFGKFNFPLPEFTDSAVLIVQTKNRLNMKSDYLIDLQTSLERKSFNHLNYDRISSIPFNPIISSQLNYRNDQPDEIIKEKKLAKRIDSYYFPGVDTFMIEEVEVKSDFLSNRDSLIFRTGDPDVVIEAAQLKRIVEEKNDWYSDIWDLLQDQIPGLSITRYPYERLKMSHANLVIPTCESSMSDEGGCDFIYFQVADNALGRLRIAVDGDFLRSTGVTLYDFLTYMDPADIESVNFIAKPKEYENAEYNSESSDIESPITVDPSAVLDPDNEVSNDQISSFTTLDNASRKLDEHFESMESLVRDLAPPSYLYITTKSKGGVLQYKPKEIATLYLNGFTNYKEYYSPKYETVLSKNQTVSDLRKTIHWDPNIVSDINGTASVSFYTNDTKNPISIMVQGLSKTGSTGVKFIQLNDSLLKNKENQEVVVKEVDKTIDDFDYESLKLIGGKVIDIDTKRPVISASIVQNEPYYQVCCNSEGEFFIEKQQLSGNENLLVCCAGYEQKIISYNKANTDLLTIELKKTRLVPSTAGSNAKLIVKKSINKSAIYYGNNQVYHGYFREAISINSNNYGIYESAFNYTNKGYSGNANSLLFETEKFKNMEDKNGHRLLILKPNHRSRFYPLATDVLSFSPAFYNYSNLNDFEYEVLGEVINANKLCYKIAFDQKDNVIHPFEKGVMYIEKETLALLCAQWEISPKARQYVSYTQYLQSNPLDYKLEVVGSYYEANYALIDEKLILQSTKNKIEVFVNNQDILQFERLLSINALSNKNKKNIDNSTFDTLIDEGKGKHILVKDAQYTIAPWVRLGIIKPEENLLRDAKFMHDVIIYR